MKKLYYIIIAIGVFIFLYWFISSLPATSEKVVTVATDYMSNSGFSSIGNFAFKSTPENPTLITEMININSQFIKAPPRPFPDISKNSIKYFYKLEKLFSDFKYYYVTKLNVENILFNELPLLLENTSSLTENELQTYFDTNKEYLEEKWGVNNFNDFYYLILTIKELNSQEIESYELEESYFYMPDQGTINFRIILTPKNNLPVYLAAKVELYNSTEYYSEPIISFLGTVLGGRS